MPKYPPHGMLRVGVLDTLDDMEFPALAQVTAGVDVTCDIAGYTLRHTTGDIPREPWSGDVVAHDPGRISFDGANFVGFRFTQPDPEPLWDLAVFRAHKYLVVRRGVLYETAWAAGQVVSTYEVHLGKRSDEDPSGETSALFVLPLHVRDFRDDAVIAA